MRIESHDRKIEELLKGHTFLIPRFQREYSWEADHVLEFWNDILNNLSDAYFIGSMVVYKRERATLAVVDGQQRLTTVTILLCAIREAFKELGEPDLADGLQAYIEQRDRENKTVYVLRTETSFPFLQEEVLKNGPSEAPYDEGNEEEAIKRAFEIFKQQIKRSIESKSSPLTWLKTLRDTVFDLNVILVTLDNEDDAYLIFETLNTRGKDLALSDLLRNHFAKFIQPQGDVDQSKLKWKKVLDTIGSSPVSLDPDTFIVHSWQSRYDFVTKAKTFPKVKAAVNEFNAKEHLNIFAFDAECWRSIYDTEFYWTKSEKNAARSLEALRIFKVTQPAPGLLSLVRAYRNEVIKYRILKKALSNIEKFHFAFNAITSSRSSGGISGMYSSFGRQIFNAKNSNEANHAIDELTRKLRERAVPDEEFDLGFSQVIYTKSHASQKSLVQYILKKVALHEKQPFIGETDDLTIEHLRPQSNLSWGDRDDVIGQIGNLMLVDAETNGLLANNDFGTKKKILRERGYKLPDMLAQAEEISEETIASNTQRISELARNNIWSI